jgi:hypothetical protein
MDLGYLWLILVIPAALIAYTAVFLVSHTLQILILLSPFAAVDAAMKLSRRFLLGTVVGTALLSPFLGAFWALLVIVICLFLAGWAFRLTVFGHVFAWDFLTRRWRRFKLAPISNPVFLGWELEGVPRRTYGQLTKGNEAEDWVFNYRPWLVGAKRQLPLPRGRRVYAMGLVHPEVLQEEGLQWNVLLDLPPRYQSHEQAFCLQYGIQEQREVGLRAAWSWLKSVFVEKPEITR